ncbi:hypothetical protein [Photobacterium damselae]|uniref:hypothetical protein n=1 Tax=Photobacterium damselae TaxID=38293 RepID=UPI002542B8C3
MTDTVLDNEQMAVNAMLEAAEKQDSENVFSADTVLEGAQDTVSSEKQARLEDIQKKAVGQLAGYGLLLVQTGARWKTGNPNLVINPELQSQFAEVLPDALEEWGVTAPEFLDKYAATMALGMTVVMIAGDMGAQNLQFKQQQKAVNDSLGGEHGEETSTNAVS